MNEGNRDPLDIPAPPTGGPELYQSLSNTFYLYLRAMHDLIKDDRPAGNVGTWVPYALFVHILQLGRAVNLLVAEGYSEEALPISRAMISAAMTLTFIVTSGNPDGWALRYYSQLADLEMRYLTREQRLARFDADRINELIVAADQNMESLRQAADKEGIVIPQKLPDPSRGKPRRDTWTGLSDKSLAERVGLLDWYEGDYDYASGITHVQAISIKPSADRLLSGHLPQIGPHYREPLAATVFAHSAVKFGFLGFMKHFRLVDRDSAFQAANNMMTTAINAYREQSGANAIVAKVFGVRTSSPNEGGGTD